VRDLRQAGCATHGAGVVLGARRHWGRRQVWTFDGPEHVLVLGATRSGKTASVLIPTLLTAETLTHLVFDPKGELYTHTSAWRAPGAGLALLPHR
jgi:type IV secretion system protein VirD4